MIDQPLWSETTFSVCHNLIIESMHCGKKNIGIYSDIYISVTSAKSLHFSDANCDYDSDCPAHCLAVSVYLLLLQQNVWGRIPYKETRFIWFIILGTSKSKQHGKCLMNVKCMDGLDSQWCSHGDYFHHPGPAQCWEMVTNTQHPTFPH